LFDIYIFNQSTAAIECMLTPY